MKLDAKFYSQGAYTMAQALIGQTLCRKLDDGTVIKKMITETECYIGTEDTACHAHRGKTPRTSMMYEAGGRAYVYLCYGLHFILNVVSGEEGYPEGVMIRSVEGAKGPGRATKLMGINSSLNGIYLAESDELWIESAQKQESTSHKRIGIDYASEEDRNRLWRFLIK